MQTDERIDLPMSAQRYAWLKELLTYPIGADRIVSVGKRYPVEVQTLRRHTFPFVVIFDPAIVKEARACAAAGARVRLLVEISKNGRSAILAKIERV